MLNFFKYQLQMENYVTVLVGSSIYLITFKHFYLNILGFSSQIQVKESNLIHLLS